MVLVCGVVSEGKMTKMRIVILLFLLVLHLSCHKSYYSYTENDSCGLVRNTVRNPSTKVLEINKRLDCAHEELSIFADIDRKNNIIAHLVYRDDEFFVQLRNPELELIKEKMLVYGKGPGEWNKIIGVVAADSMFGFLELLKSTIELFDSELRYKDSIPLQEGARLYFAPSSIMKTDDIFLLCPTVPNQIIRIDEKGKIQSKTEQDFMPADKNEFLKYFSLNAGYMKADDDGYVYVAFSGKENTYELRKFDSSLSLVWVNAITDEYKDVLSTKTVQLRNGSVQPSRAASSRGIDTDDRYIYVLRGVGGYTTYNEEDKPVITVIPGLQHGFIDVFEKSNGKHAFRIQAPFLKTNALYSMKIFNGKFYFFSRPEYQDNILLEGTNCIYVASIVE